MMIKGKFKKLRYGLKKRSKNISNLGNLITKCNFTLALLDGLEELRFLSTAEKNFQRILQEHKRKLIEARRIYWKIEPKSDGQLWQMRILSISTLLQQKAIEEILLHILNLLMVLWFIIMITRLLLFGNPVKKELV
jgi:hypothetical protein